MISMHHALTESMAFVKYSGLMSLLEYLGVTTKKESRRGNASLSSERFKDELVKTLG